MYPNCDTLSNVPCSGYITAHDQSMVESGVTEGGKTRASGKAGIRNPKSGIGTGIGTGTGTGTGIGTGMGRETYIKAGTTFTLI